MSNTAQTFFVDPASVQNADVISITSVDLYFKAKPNRTTNETGIVAPGVTVALCQFNPTNNTIVQLTSARMGYDSIFDSSTAVAVTTFTFPTPATIATNKTYAFVVYPEDGGYDLWINRSGDRVTGSSDRSGGATTNKQGQMFVFTGDGLQNEQTNTQLKFAVNVAKYNDTSATIDLVNRGYEFLTLNNRTNTFTGGENVFANTAALAGTVGVTANSTYLTGSGTAFTSLVVGQSVVITSGPQNQVVTITNVTDSTHANFLPPASFTNTAAVYRNGLVGKLVTGDYVENKIVLTDSTANSTVYFTAGLLLTGEQSAATANVTAVTNLPVDRFIAHVDATTTLSGSVSATYDLAFSNGSVYAVDNTFASMVSGVSQIVPGNTHYVLSRSNEVAQNYLYDNNKSAVAKITLTTSSPFAAPILNDRNTDLVIYQNQISNVYTRAYSNGQLYDSEVGPNGTAVCKVITEKMTFDAGRKAEDLVVYCSAFRPANTHIRFYARIYNADDSEPFDDKAWSPLEYKLNAAVRSSVDAHDYIEYQLGLPQSPATLSTVGGTFTTTANSAIITAVAVNPSTTFTTGQTVKVYNPLFPTNYTIGKVAASNSTTLTLDQTVDVAGATGTGQKIDILEFGQVAYNNKSNFNISRYYNSLGAALDGYTTVQVKAVLLADSTTIVPDIDQIEVIGVSA